MTGAFIFLLFIVTARGVALAGFGDNKLMRVVGTVYLISALAAVVAVTS